MRSTMLDMYRMTTGRFIGVTIETILLVYGLDFLFNLGERIALSGSVRLVCASILLGPSVGAAVFAIADFSEEPHPVMLGATMGLVVQVPFFLLLIPTIQT